MKAAIRHIDPVFIRECFSMNSDGVLFWKERPAHHFTKVGNGRGWFQPYVGARAGRINNNGYYMVSLRYQGRSYKVLNHRIVWLLVHGEWPRQFIDHINRVRTDNRPCNLRDVSHAENMRNSVHTHGRPAGLIGAYQSSGGRFRSQINCDGRYKYLGTFDSAEEASAAFLRARAELKSQQTQESA